MAEATLTYFEEFEPGPRDEFSERVFQTVGSVVYGKEPEEVTTHDVTFIVIQAGPGSKTEATAGAEVKVDLDDEDWPKDGYGHNGSVEGAQKQCVEIKQIIGNLLLGGVNREEGAVVNVWVRQFPATGWYGEGSR